MLLADNNDDENNLLLDDEDVNFLEEDVDKTGEEVIIERPVPVPAPAQIFTTAIVPTPYPSQSVLKISSVTCSVLTQHSQTEKADSSSSSSLERYLPKTQRIKRHDVG